MRLFVLFFDPRIAAHAPIYVNVMLYNVESIVEFSKFLRIQTTPHFLQVQNTPTGGLSYHVLQSSNRLKVTQGHLGVQEHAKGPKRVCALALKIRRVRYARFLNLCRKQRQASQGVTNPGPSIRSVQTQEQRPLPSWHVQDWTHCHPKRVSIPPE
ncbi:hypothetical protein ASD8599_02200 [Ascidiaceihabitans donghaensis]|uniref:Uncharacterized protein n=1 Tax=Ascidiaceihabitans donghaensis TaxID=1510460 RepID=A0A2R8BEE2_9RHOB|nr:hypothetical protein ASD8599_02200 [Ascidiaceihabitans donghaensis]